MRQLTKKKVFGFLMICVVSGFQSVLLMGSAVWAVPITLISDSNSCMATFAVGDIKQALSSKGHTVTESSLSQLDRIEGACIVLAVLENKTAIPVYDPTYGRKPPQINKKRLKPIE